MNTYHLKYFHDAAEFGSMSKSAQINRVTHSAISQAIKTLEIELGTDLLVHSRRRFELTAAGQLCLLEAKKILYSVSQFKEVIQVGSKVPFGHLTVVAPQSLIAQSLSVVIMKFIEQYPKVKLRVQAGPSMQIRAGILGGGGDLGITIDDGLLGEFDSVPLHSGNFLLISKASGKNTELKSLPQRKFLVTENEKIEVLHLRKSYRAFFHAEPNFHLEMMSWGVIKSLCLHQDFVGYVPDYCVLEELKTKQLIALRVPWKPYRYRLKAIWNKGKLSPNAQLFLGLLEKQVS